MWILWYRTFFLTHFILSLLFIEKNLQYERNVHKIFTPVISYLDVSTQTKTAFAETDNFFACILCPHFTRFIQADTEIRSLLSVCPSVTFMCLYVCQTFSISLLPEKQMSRGILVIVLPGTLSARVNLKRYWSFPEKPKNYAHILKETCLTMQFQPFYDLCLLKTHFEGCFIQQTH